VKGGAYLKQIGLQKWTHSNLLWHAIEALQKTALEGILTIVAKG
jgi:hypothetical protein